MLAGKEIFICWGLSPRSSSNDAPLHLKLRQPKVGGGYICFLYSAWTLAESLSGYDLRGLITHPQASSGKSVSTKFYQRSKDRFLCRLRVTTTQTPSFGLILRLRIERLGLIGFGLWPAWTGWVWMKPGWTGCVKMMDWFELVGFDKHVVSPVLVQWFCKFWSEDISDTRQL